MTLSSIELQEGTARKKLRLTAAIINYNHGRYLSAAVEAMVKQSRPADELIVIDDASTDGSQRTIDELSRRFPCISVVKHEVNRGINPTVQAALDMATGDYFYCGGADDMVLPGFFESAMSLLERYPTAPLCAGVPIQWFEESDQQFETCLGLKRKLRFYEREELWPIARLGALEICGAWAIFCVSELKALGGFRASLKWHSDWLPVYALALGRGVAWTGQPTAVMRFHSKNYSIVGADQRNEQRQVLAELARLVVMEMPPETQIGFRSSGMLGQMGWPMMRVLLSKRRYWSQLSPSFWRVCLKLIAYRAVSPLARRILPKVLRRAVAQTTRSQTNFDLSAMKLRKEA